MIEAGRNARRAWNSRDDAEAADQVVQFVGFMAAYRNPGNLNPTVAATLAASLTTWVTFTPSFLWIFLGASFIETMRGNAALTGAMSAISSRGRCHPEPGHMVTWPLEVARSAWCAR
jgi:hypothetical protein